MIEARDREKVKKNTERQKRLLADLKERAKTDPEAAIQLEALRAKRRQYANDYNRKRRAEKSGACQK